MLETLTVSLAFISVLFVAIAIVLMGIDIVKRSDKDLTIITIGLSMASIGALLLVATISRVTLL